MAIASIDMARKNHAWNPTSCAATSTFPRRAAIAVATIKEVVNERFLINSSLELLKSFTKTINLGFKEILYLLIDCQIQTK